MPKRFRRVMRNLLVLFFILFGLLFSPAAAHEPIFIAQFTPFAMWQEAAFNPDAICTGGGTLSTTCFVNTSENLANGTVISGTGNLVIQSGGSLTSSQKESFSISMGGNFTIETGGSIVGNPSEISATNITIETASSIDSSGLGESGSSGASGSNGEGLGAGLGAAVTGGGGGGHGGAGGAGDSGGAGGGTYGSLTNPVTFGSGGGAGGNGHGGAGGGAIKLLATGTIDISGDLISDGNDGSNGSDGDTYECHIIVLSYLSKFN